MVSRGTGDDGMGFYRSSIKASKFFEYGDISADSKNYNYAIECHVGGLRHDPDNLNRHKRLYEIAVKRKLDRTTAASEEPSPIGPSLVDKMLMHEHAWALDPSNQKLLLRVIQAATYAQDRIGEMAKIDRVIAWLELLAKN